MHTSNFCLVYVSTGPELALLYLFGILGALELVYNNRVLVGVLVYSLIGVLDNAENEPAEFFIKELHSLHEPACAGSTAALLPAACCVPAACVRACASERTRATACVRACVAMRADACRSSLDL
jgi:hypothetical protein